MRVLVFGVFDGLHDGHKFFLARARELGDHLFAAVAPDNIVSKLKGRPPEFTLEERIEKIMKETPVDSAFAGDGELSAWNSILFARPDIIALGYDQIYMTAEIENFTRKNNLAYKIVITESFKPESLHSSLLRSKPSGERPDLA